VKTFVNVVSYDRQRRTENLSLLICIIDFLTTTLYYRNHALIRQYYKSNIIYIFFFMYSYRKILRGIFNAQNHVLPDSIFRGLLPIEFRDGFPAWEKAIPPAKKHYGHDRDDEDCGASDGENWRDFRLSFLRNFRKISGNFIYCEVKVSLVENRLLA
jgi:hypothetical protein